MSNVTVEQKMQLVRQIRSRYSENQYDIHNRERILYGVQDGAKASVTPGEFNGGEEAAVSRFRLRFFLALLFLTALVVMDKNHIEVAGITAEMVQGVISADYEEEIDAWAEGLAAAYSSPSR